VVARHQGLAAELAEQNMELERKVALLKEIYRF
jgi:hypothetical protein